MLDDPVPLLKQQLAREIVLIADQLNFFVAADLLDLGTSRYSKLRMGKVQYFSLDKLVRLLSFLDVRVEVRVVKSGAGSVNTMQLARLQGARRRARQEQRSERARLKRLSATPPNPESAQCTHDRAGP